MKKIFFSLLPVFVLSCTSVQIEPEIIEMKPIPVQKKPEVEDIALIYDVFLFDEMVFSNPPEDVHWANVTVPEIHKGELFIKEFFPEDKILRLIALKERFFTINELSEGGFHENEVTAIYSGNEDYYIGTRRGGVIRYNLDNGSFSVIKLPDNTLYNRSITGILSFKGRILISSYSGLFSYDPYSEAIRHISEGLTDKGFISLCKIEDKVYLGTAKGYLYSWDLIEMKLVFTSENIPVSLISYINGFIVVGLSGRGLFLYDPEDRTMEAIDILNRSLNDNKVTVVAYFNGLYYVGTSGSGLLSFDVNLKKIEENQKGALILSTTQSENIIYFGTHSDGLLFYDRMNDTWNKWGFREGLSSLYIPAIYFNEANIYISTPDRGIVIIDEQIHAKNL